MRSEPSHTWYVRLLAVRDTLYNFCINYPKLHSRAGTTVLLIICNLTAILDLRFLHIRDGAGRKQGRKLTVALPLEWANFLGRPAQPLHEARIHDVVTFLALQISGTVGATTTEDHIIYS